jgi:hypothetical protein
MQKASLYFLAILLLSSCSHRFANLPASTEVSCGYQRVAYAVFSKCVEEELSADTLQASHNERAGSPAELSHDEMSDDFKSGLEGIVLLREQDLISDDQAYVKYRARQQQFAQREAAHNQTVKNVGAVLAVGAAVGGAAYAVSRGGGGGGYSSPDSDYRGCCSWHGGISYCDTGAQKLMCTDGHYSPTCGC